MSTDLAGIKVLVVNDDADIVLMLSTALSVYGAEVRTAISVTAALKIFRDWPPDVLVSDISMPEDNGYQLISEIRKLPTEQRNTPAIALSGLPLSACTQAINFGFSCFMRKPIELEELISVVAHLANRQ